MVRDITVAYGDGIGPEIMQATLKILAKARAELNIETIEVGEAYYTKGVSTGIPPQAWESLYRNKILLKAPITTPQGGGYKSLNVTLRKTLGLYANVRPCVTYHPYVTGLHEKMDMVIIRENEEDLYSGIEYQQTAGTVHGIKLITAGGSERIIRYAFEYARQNGRKKVTCMSKDNIMKMADGMFHRIYDEVGKEYPEIEKDHYIIDIGSARIASRPELFDVVVTENLYGDIISDIAAEVCGSVGLAGSANIGLDFAMFEAIHGSAPDIAGQNIANPSGLINGAVMMLVHIGQGEKASLIKNAWLKTIEDGVHTGDIYGPDSKERVGTQEFADAVIDRLGEEPNHFAKAEYKDTEEAVQQDAVTPEIKEIPKSLHGVDVFIEWHGEPDDLGKKLSDSSYEGKLYLKLISAKGLKIWPDCEVACSRTDTLRCRFMAKGEKEIEHSDIIELLKFIHDSDLEFLKTENLYHIGGERGFTLCQGE